jgi:alkylation response protein AidB-like acyl-CoA dehydrogenase
MTEILERVAALRSRIRSFEAEMTDKRRLPSELVEELRATGVFGMAMPAEWGGPELSVLDQLAIIEELSYANGSVGWCAMIGCDSGYYSAFLDEGAARELYPSLDLITAGLAMPACSANEVDGGYRVSGRWRFGSGVTHADRIVGGAMILDRDGAFLPGEGSLPKFRTLFLPIDQVEIIDTWHTTGLEGSGSNDYAVEDAFVPDAHAFYPLGKTNRDGPLYRMPWWFIVKVGAVPLGIGQRAIDDLCEIAQSKLVFPAMVMLRDEARTHEAVARAEAMIGSARAYLTDVTGSVWDQVAATGEADPRARAKLRLAMHNAAFASRDAVSLLYDTATTTAVYQPSPLDQALRDLTTICQHIVLSTRILDPIGKALLGQDPSAPMF